MAGLEGLFRPGAVAVMGASRTPGKIGHVILRNVMNGYRGQVYPVNPREEEILGLKCYPGIGAVGRPVDVAVVAVPAEAALEVAGECGRAGVKFLVVVTAGFKEIGPEGMARERALLATCRDNGMRLVGPNCVGVMDTHTPLNASFAGSFPGAGRIAFISQSGAMLLSILDWSLQGNLGFSQFISMGNKADLNEADFIEAAGEDEQTGVILCYIEDVTEGEEFLRAAAAASLKKPVVVLKSGTSQAGARAASSHTGALAGSDLAYDTAFRQCGIIRAHSMAELFDLAAAFASQPAPGGRRVAIVTNSGGPGIVTTDNVELQGLKMAGFSRETSEALRAGLPAEASVYNPVDVLGDARAERFRFALEKSLSDEGVDGALVLVCPAAVTEPLETAEAILELKARFPEKPLFAAYMGGEALLEGSRKLAAGGVPCFTFPEPAVRAMSGLYAYRQARRKLLERSGQLDFPGLEREGVRSVLEEVRRDRRQVLLGNEGARLAAAYGIPAAPVELARTAGEAEKLAGRLGYPVVLKVASPKILHKSDVGGVKVGLRDAGEVRRAFLSILESVHRYLPDTPVYGVEVQRMMPPGTEVIIGMTRDVQFGPLLAFGLGGVYVNLLKDVSFRLAWGLDSPEIEAMLAETKAYTLLRGYRGEAPRDLPAVAEVVGRLARLALDFPEVAELEINPLLAYPEGCSALDVKVTVKGWEALG